MSDHIASAVRSLSFFFGTLTVALFVAGGLSPWGCEVGAGAYAGWCNWRAWRAA